jgi:hypothetical protein
MSGIWTEMATDDLPGSSPTIVQRPLVKWSITPDCLSGNTGSNPVRLVRLHSLVVKQRFHKPRTPVRVWVESLNRARPTKPPGDTYFLSVALVVLNKR